ncbi:MAG: DUF3536 domain-containing protein, partial [Chloroflexi bacterium]|nr:DUF3536 domain-containing protein [Chloroflexota bacterium]
TRAQESNGYTLTTLGLFLRDHPPRDELTIVENTAWSCSHRLDRWVVGCDCTPGSSRWKAGLRRALDNLAGDLDKVYEREAQRLGFAPYPLRDDYIVVALREMDGQAFLANHNMGHLSSDDSRQVIQLLEAQLYRQRMYASCTFFFEDLGRYEPRYAIASAARAIALTQCATGDDLTDGFRRDLRVAISSTSQRSGADILDEISSQADI